ncbi:MAG TPA: AtpZ/AtpI family protein [Vicinamibacterales bacterium]|jgi:ATP synthase protein I|nr:AtpZ/AtpI family protein [Acidobacteriota bacterium]HQX80936.1 AtpZ/AtpI family protein [Vicinamibacterales bacterium]
MQEVPRPGGKKPRLDTLKSFERSMRAFQENVQRAGPAASASYTLTGGILLLGGLGYVADRWLGTSPWLLISGLVLGIVVGFYALIMASRRGQV